MSKQNIILSVMVISHNQAHLIGRCLDSILRQRIRVPWEIVISDDASTDETWSVIQDYVSRYSQESLPDKDGFYIPEMTCSQINSSDYNPTVTSDRCAANKANVYIHARGKYCVNIDADDYLLGDDIYQYQIDQLENHPECSVAMQNIWYQNDGSPLENGHTWHCESKLVENRIIDAREYCIGRYFVSNPALMMRRDFDLLPMERYGLLFDDSIISMHHILRGKIICSSRAQYVYVQYKNSIWNQVLGNCQDADFRMMTPMLAYLKFFPAYSSILVNAEVFNWLSATKRILSANKVEVTTQTIRYLEYFNNFYLECLLKRKHKFYLIIGLKLGLLISRYEICAPSLVRIYRLYIGVKSR